MREYSRYAFFPLNDSIKWISINILNNIFPLNYIIITKLYYYNNYWEYGNWELVKPPLLIRFVCMAEF